MLVHLAMWGLLALVHFGFGAHMTPQQYYQGVYASSYVQGAHVSDHVSVHQSTTRSVSVKGNITYTTTTTRTETVTVTGFGWEAQVQDQQQTQCQTYNGTARGCWHREYRVMRGFRSWHHGYDTILRRLRVADYHTGGAACTRNCGPIKTHHGGSSSGSHKATGSAHGSGNGSTAGCVLIKAPWLQHGWMWETYKCGYTWYWHATRSWAYRGGKLISLNPAWDPNF